MKYITCCEVQHVSGLSSTRYFFPTDLSKVELTLATCVISDESLEYERNSRLYDRVGLDQRYQAARHMGDLCRYRSRVQVQVFVLVATSIILHLQVLPKLYNPKLRSERHGSNA